MDNLLFAETLAGVLGSGLIAGAFFAFSTFVMKALGNLPAEKGIAAMQSINVAVINPWFLGVFLGTMIPFILMLISAFTKPHLPGTALRVAASALYILGGVGVTRACNIPRNDALAAVDPASAKGAKVWADYLKQWTAWNHVRTVAIFASTTALAFSLRN